MQPTSGTGPPIEYRETALGLFRATRLVAAVVLLSGAIAWGSVETAFTFATVDGTGSTVGPSLTRRAAVYAPSTLERPGTFQVLRSDLVPAQREGGE